jgi:hypothetical protein
MTQAERSRKWYRSNLKKARRLGRLQQRRWRKENPEEARRRNAASWKKREAANKQIVLNWKRSHPCVDCGESDPIVLDAHHRNPRKKLFRLAAGVTRRPPLEIQAELRKCIALCSNCHRRRHAASP